ncbi:hypothetical protein MMC11_003104 [Xylographa trunciseda]|nr:hypothetical protein [Xylographa trunciseda]
MVETYMAIRSWIPIPADSHFSLANLPFGIISTAIKANPHPAVAIGEHALDLELFAAAGGFSELSSINRHLAVFSQPTLNAFAALGRAVHREVRKYLQDIFAETTDYPHILKSNPTLQRQVLIQLTEVTNHLPMQIGDYTDFYAGRNHAYNVGVLFRGPDNALQPNYNHLPVGYHGRASSVVVSGTPIRRPCGQILQDPSAVPKIPVFSPSKRLDIELELAAFVCKSNDIGDPIPVDKAEEHLFGFVLMNDWSARDIQAWEYVPLGPFNAKNFGTSVSPWIVLADALEPFRCSGLENKTDLLRYLQEGKTNNVYDINLEIDLTTPSGTTTRITRTNSKNLLFSFPQMLAHHTVTGCPMRVGDLIGSGTITGTEPGTQGSMLEQCSNGNASIKLNDGEERTFLRDGDTVTLRGWSVNSDGSRIGFAIAAVLFFAIRYFNRTDVAKIKGIPEIPGVPIFGNLLQLGNEHAKVAGAWVKQYGPVFQVRMGNKRIILANTFDSVKHLWITNQSALISRPTLHTFHTVVSSSQGYTIGTSPWDDSCKRRRKAAATALNRPAVQSYMPIIDLESKVSIKELLTDSKDGAVDIDPNPYFQRFALNTSLTLNYGVRIDGKIDDELLREIVHVERVVSNLRSTSNNWQDYIPLLRLWPSRNSQAGEYRSRRDKYMALLLNKLRDKIAKGEDKPCITGNILKDPEANLNEAEINSICLTMVSAGLDTVPGNLIMAIAYLSSSHGQEIQEHAYAEIQKVYPNGDAWEKCLVEERVPYITAFVKEVLRFWTVIPICLPRVSIKDIQWQDATIPAGTTFYMNAWAADYDPTHFSSPHLFLPERYLDVSEGSGTPHYAYGAGSRMCAGSHLANRELYTAFIRIFSALRILPPKDPQDQPVLDALECNAVKTSLTTEPKKFKVGVRVRDRGRLEGWLGGL